MYGNTVNVEQYLYVTAAPQLSVEDWIPESMQQSLPINFAQPGLTCLLPVNVQCKVVYSEIEECSSQTETATACCDQLLTACCYRSSTAVQASWETIGLEIVDTSGLA